MFEKAFNPTEHASERYNQPEGQRFDAGWHVAALTSVEERRFEESVNWQACLVNDSGEVHMQNYCIYHPESPRRAAFGFKRLCNMLTAGGVKQKIRSADQVKPAVLLVHVRIGEFEEKPFASIDAVAPVAQIKHRIVDEDQAKAMTAEAARLKKNLKKIAELNRPLSDDDAPEWQPPSAEDLGLDGALS